MAGRPLRRMRQVAIQNADWSKRQDDKITDPLAAFADLVTEARWWMDRMAATVEGLKGDLRYDGSAGEQLRAEVALYERAMDRMGVLLSLWVKLNMDERMVRLDERRTAMLEVVVRALFADPRLGLTAEQQQAAPKLLAEHIRAA